MATAPSNFSHDTFYFLLSPFYFLMALTNRMTMAVTGRFAAVPRSFAHEPAANKPAPPNGDFVFTAVAATNLLTSNGHGLLAGEPVRFTTTGTLPAGLSLATTYYVIASGLTANDFKVSATVGGAEIDITDAGSGVHSWHFYLTAPEQAEFDTWLAFFTEGEGMLPDAPTLPGAITLLNKLVGYHQSAAYLTWWHDDQLSREAQFRLRQADMFSANDLTIPPSADPGGVGSAPPSSPVPRDAT